MQYKEKKFVFYFTLFIYLVTTKVFLFKSITIYNTNFQIRINKLSSLDKNLSIDLLLAAYFHRIKVIYFYFAII